MSQRASRAAEQVQPESIEKSIDHLLDECRMVLPGVQAIFGFQLIAVFNRPFFKLLDGRDQALHLVALVLVAVAIACLMGPAAYHRQATPDAISQSFLRYASRLLMFAMIPLAGAVTLYVYLVAGTILRSPGRAVALAEAVCFVFVTIWFIIPQRAARRRAVSLTNAGRQ